MALSGAHDDEDLDTEFRVQEYRNYLKAAFTVLKSPTQTVINTGMNTGVLRRDTPKHALRVWGAMLGVAAQNLRPLEGDDRIAERQRESRERPALRKESEEEQQFLHGTD